MMSKIKFFNELKNNYKMKDLEFRELMQCFTLQKVKEGKDVFCYGDIGKTFYIIIQGTCSVKVRNPKIKEWYAEYQRFK